MAVSMQIQATHNITGNTVTTTSGSHSVGPGEDLREIKLVSRDVRELNDKGRMRGGITAAGPGGKLFGLKTVANKLPSS